MSDNYLYKIKIDNTNNIAYGDGTTKFAITMPTNIQQALIDRVAEVWVETCQMKAVVASVDVGTDYLCIMSNIQNMSSYSNTSNSDSRVLCYFNPTRKFIAPVTTGLISIEYPTCPILVRDLPPVLEFFIADSFTEAQVTLNAGNLWFLTLCIKIVY